MSIFAPTQENAARKAEQQAAMPTNERFFNRLMDEVPGGQWDEYKDRVFDALDDLEDEGAEDSKYDGLRTEITETLKGTRYEIS